MIYARGGSICCLNNWSLWTVHRDVNMWVQKSISTSRRRLNENKIVSLTFEWSTLIKSWPGQWKELVVLNISTVSLRSNQAGALNIPYTLACYISTREVQCLHFWHSKVPKQFQRLVVDTTVRGHIQDRQTMVPLEGNKWQRVNQNEMGQAEYLWRKAIVRWMHHTAAQTRFVRNETKVEHAVRVNGPVRMEADSVGEVNRVASHPLLWLLFS